MSRCYVRYSATVVHSKMSLALARAREKIVEPDLPTVDLLRVRPRPRPSDLADDRQAATMVWYVRARNRTRGKENHVIFLVRANRSRHLSSDLPCFFFYRSSLQQTRLLPSVQCRLFWQHHQSSSPTVGARDGRPVIAVV